MILPLISLILVKEENLLSIRLTTEDYQDMMNDECMEMTEDDIKKVITSCRKRLGKPKQYSGNLTFEDQPTKTNCCEPKGFGK